MTSAALTPWPGPQPPSESEIEALLRRRRAARGCLRGGVAAVTFDEASVEAIAGLFGVEARKAPFEVPKLPPGAEGQPATEKAAPVYQMTVPSAELGQPLL